MESLRTGKHRFHLLGLVHLPVTRRYMGCAFTQKIVKMADMLLSLGHEVYLYGAEGSDTNCTEFIQTHTLNDIRDAWGEGDNRFEIGYDWKRHGFRHDFNAKLTQATIKFNRVAAQEIVARKRDDDFLLVMQGVYQKPVSDVVNLWLTLEPGIGYRGSYARFRAFESASLQNFTYGFQNHADPGGVNGHYYDRVIPNYFDPQDFTFQPNKGDYALYIGRMIERKGYMTAVKAASHAGVKLILAGQGDPSKLPSNCEFIGYVEPEQRDELMGKAFLTFVPTLYLEAFGGVNVESQLTGTPVATTNFGVFPETVRDRETGYLCNTLDDFVGAVHDAPLLSPARIREHAERYLTTNVRWEFQRWFNDLYQLYLSAHNPGKKGWHWVREEAQ